MSVLTAMKSTCVIPASIMRSTAFSPAPPTPTRRMIAAYDAVSRARSRRAGWSGSGSSQRAAFEEAVRRSSGAGSWSGSGAGASDRIGVGSGDRGCSARGRCASRVRGGSAAEVGGGESGGSTGSSCCPLWSFLSLPLVPWRCAASVARKSSARGPSRMLARFLAIEHLLREVAVHAGGFAGRFVGQDRNALDRRLGEANRLADPGLVDEVAEVLAQDLVGFTRVRDALVVHRRNDAEDRDLRVQVLAHHRERVLELHETAQGEVLRLHGDEDAGGSDECVDRQQAERRRGGDEDEVVVVA